MEHATDTSIRRANDHKKTCISSRETGQSNRYHALMSRCTKRERLQTRQGTGIRREGKKMENPLKKVVLNFIVDKAKTPVSFCFRGAGTISGMLTNRPIIHKDLYTCETSMQDWLLEPQNSYSIRARRPSTCSVSQGSGNGEVTGVVGEGRRFSLIRFDSVVSVLRYPKEFITWSVSRIMRQTSNSSYYKVPIR